MRDDEELTPRSASELERELGPALDATPEPKARAAFRAELRERFLRGDFADEVERGEELPLRVPRPATGSQRRLWGAVALIAASVALLLVVRPWEAAPSDVEPGTGEVVVQAPPAEPDDVGETGETAPEPAPIEPVAPVADASPRVAWSVVGEVGRVRVDGALLEDASAVDAALAAGREVEVVAGDLRLRLADVLLLEAGESTSLTLDAASDVLAFELERGVVRVCTGPDFAGRRLGLRTQDAEVDIVGTSFAVDLYDNGTCVCCTEGTVAVAPHDADERHDVEAGAMAFAYRDRTVECATGGVIEEHAVPLRALEEAAASLW